MKGEIFDIMKSKPYLEQWLRVNRLFELVSLVELGKISDEQIYKYKFDLYLSFFVQCYHLRDWIVNSKVVKSHEIDEFIKSSYEFGLCRNLCLGVKHYHVTKPSTPQMADFSQDVGIKIPIVREYLIIRVMEKRLTEFRERDQHRGPGVIPTDRQSAFAAAKVP